MGTKKDFATIKEMSNQKLLNLEQKKVLVKLFEHRIDQKQTSARNEADRQEEQMRKDLLKKYNENKRIVGLMTSLDKADKTIKESEKELEKLGLDYDSNYSRDKRKLELDRNHYPREFTDFREKSQAKLAKIGELKLKLQADIYNLPMTYQEINDYLENEISKV